uniref:HotDog ACOT-type domain-containing protein n=1 Tax=Chenopodium quinoa TaxID=63459 RepID=A0A803KTR8_CHEQI
MWLGFTGFMENLLQEEVEIMESMELERDWVLKFSDDFRVLIGEDGSKMLELVRWDPALAVTALEREFMVDEEKVKKAFKFPVKHGKELDLEDDDVRRLNLLNTLPLVSPYSDGWKHELSSLEAEKYRVGVIHEFLSLTLEKKASIHHIVEFKEEFSLTKHTYQMLKKQPRTFYLAGTEMNWVVFLKDGYDENGNLIQKDPQQERWGKMLEDLDALAGTISYKHCSNPDGMTRPILLVTASVDKILLKKPIRIDADLSLVGAVHGLGGHPWRCSLKCCNHHKTVLFYMLCIYLWVDGFDEKKIDGSQMSNSVALVANFTFVARDGETGKSSPINHISPETTQEKLLWEQAEARNKMRRLKRAEQNKEKNKKVVSRIDKLLAEGQEFVDLPALADMDSILIRDTCQQSSMICQPQQQNVHGRIFGGYLMRKASELAFSTAYTFDGASPRFVEVDHVYFVKPVDVGNFLRMKSCTPVFSIPNF